MRTRTIVFLAFVMLCTQGRAQIQWSGQAAVHFLQSGATGSPRQIDQGRQTFGWRSDLFIDAFVSDNVAVLSNYRIMDDEHLFFDDFAIRLMHLTSADVNIQAGKFDMPFGNLGVRRFPRDNPLYSLPVLYEYQTSLPHAPVTESQLLSLRGKGVGLRMLDQGIYDIGVEVYGAVDRLTYAAALSNGTVSTATYGNPNWDNDLAKVFRVTWTPATGLTLGAAYTWGAYLYEFNQAYPDTENLSSYLQKSTEIDVAFSLGHFVLAGEGVYSNWAFPLERREVNLGAFGYYAEAKYTFIPRLYGALRLSGLRFQKISLQGVDQPWDFNVTEWEGGIGYFLDRNVLVKLIRRETRTFGGTNPKDHLTVVQLAASF